MISNLDFLVHDFILGEHRKVEERLELAVTAPDTLIALFLARPGHDGYTVAQVKAAIDETLEFVKECDGAESLEF